MITKQSSLNQAISNQSKSKDLNSNNLNSNASSQIQIDQQIEYSTDETSLIKRKTNGNQSISFHETDTIDLLTSNQRLETEPINRKRKTKEESQNALKKKYDSIKTFTLMLSVDQALKNAQTILFEDLKVAKTKHVIIQ
jgi:sucrose-6-phosphate hydrolase SacC (GH32 family)